MAFLRTFKNVLLRAFRVLGVAIFAVILFAVVFVGFFFATPEFTLPTSQLRSLIAKYSPSSLDIAFGDLEIRVQRPPGLWFSKRLSLQANALCIRYEGEAVNACFNEVSLGITGGWSGRDPESKIPWYWPGLISLDPIRMTEGNVLVDLPRLPQTPEPQKKTSSFDIVNFLRTEILPKWKLDGSFIELKPLKIVTEPGSGFIARADLTTGEDGDALRVALHDFQMLGSPMNARGLVRVASPGAEAVWRLWAKADVQLDTVRRIQVRADSEIASWKDLHFRIGTKWRGIAALREANLEGDLKQPLLNSLLSLKMGQTRSSIRALDFANCAVSANLDAKIAGLRCGPQTVRLQLYEKSLIKNPRLFVLHPEFEIRATRIQFGETKGASFEAKVSLNHYEYLRFETSARGEVRQDPGGKPLKYDLEGQLGLAVEKLQRVVRLFDRTPLEVPAPVNGLDGPVSLNTKFAMNEQGGGVEYKFATRLDSEYQALHLRLDGQTRLEKAGDELLPRTEASLALDSVRLSAPRIDVLSAPPKFIPDSRFGPIRRDAFADPPRLEKKARGKPMDLRLRIFTSAPNAVQIATNLTTSPIPISVDLVYDQRKAASEPSNLPPTPLHPSSSGPTESKLTGAPPSRKPGVTGWITVGQTPVELFRRQATVQQIRLDLLEDGNQRLNGIVQVPYLDYDISVLLMGTTAQPQVKLVSDPPLSDSEIIAVLLYGRGPDELSADDRDSVSNARAALANATLGISSLYLLANTPIESVGYNPDNNTVTAKVGLGGGASVELGGNSTGAAAGFNKKLSKDFVFRSEVENLGSSGQRVVSALVEWIKRF